MYSTVQYIVLHKTIWHYPEYEGNPLQHIRRNQRRKQVSFKGRPEFDGILQQKR